MKLNGTLLIGVTLLIVFSLLFINTFERHQLKNNPSIFRNSFGTHRRKPISENDIYYIAPWMTFDYINNLFNLPNAYLKEIVPINDAKYPFLTIDQYTKRTNGDSESLIIDTQRAVKIYLEATSTQK